jgi:hypothetical protein
MIPVEQILEVVAPGDGRADLPGEVLTERLARRLRAKVTTRRCSLGGHDDVYLLVTTGHPDMQRYAHPNLGRLVQPRHYSSVAAHGRREGYVWAADNDCFQGLKAPAPTGRCSPRSTGCRAAGS